MKKMNNKGFSLVELIIVIAIMAILIVVLAPQYLKYVERSRNSTDMQNITEITSAIQIYAADPESPATLAAGDYDIKVDKTNGTCSNATVVQAVQNAGLDLSTIKCSSKTAWDNYTITVKVATDGGVSFDYKSAVGTATNNNLKDKMAGKVQAAPVDPE